MNRFFGLSVQATWPDKGRDKRVAPVVDAVLAVLPLQPKISTIPPSIQEALDKRQAARQNKDWAEADKQRDYIQSQGYLIEDSPTGPKIKPL